MPDILIGLLILCFVGVVPNAPESLTPDNLNNLNSDGSLSVYLTSKENVAVNSAWLNGVAADGNGKTKGAIPCAVIVNNRGSGRVDASWMYFYEFNQGGDFFGSIVDDHVRVR